MYGGDGYGGDRGEASETGELAPYISSGTGNKSTVHIRPTFRTFLWKGSKMRSIDVRLLKTYPKTDERDSLV